MDANAAQGLLFHLIKQMSAFCFPFLCIIFDLLRGAKLMQLLISCKLFATFEKIADYESKLSNQGFTPGNIKFFLAHGKYSNNWH